MNHHGVSCRILGHQACISSSSIWNFQDNNGRCNTSANIPDDDSDAEELDEAHSSNATCPSATSGTSI